MSLAMEPEVNRSLEGLHATVPVPAAGRGFWRHWRAYTGPAFLVSVGYMDPGNWGTDLEAGAQYRYGLLWVVALSSFMAIIMQVASARLGIATGKDLAQACRDFYWPWTRWPLWVLCEIAIMACDLAEVLGSAVALHLLFGVPLFWAVIITAFDVLLLLALQGFGMRFIEAIILVLVGTIGACYFIEIFVLPQTHPDFVEMGQALLRPSLGEKGMVLVAIGIVGATVMPHNLYLHSALVQSRRLRTDDQAKRRAITFNTIDTVLALSVAFFVNASILVMAADTLQPHTRVVEDNLAVAAAADDGEKAIQVTDASGKVLYQGKPDWIFVAPMTLAPLLGTSLAGILFAVALFASGQSSTITGTLAGQVVMEGFMHWRIRPWARRLITRSLAIIPAVLIVGMYGEGSVTDLLILSQAVLALQLPFAMVPLLHFTSSKKWMGSYRNGWFLLTAGWVSCALIIALNVYGLPGAIEGAWKVVTGD